MKKLLDRLCMRIISCELTWVKQSAFTFVRVTNISIIAMTMRKCLLLTSITQVRILLNPQLMACNDLHFIYVKTAVNTATRATILQKMFFHLQNDLFLIL